MNDFKKQSKLSKALHYHAYPTPGKIAVVPTKACETSRDLALAYSPGVAEPCLEIARDKELVYNYTARGNLVAVISNGTAVLGLGDIGPEASKPVMEGKGVLFKTLSDIDVFDLELDCRSSEHFIETVAALAPTFGGINLEDIKAPECFEIEEALKARLDIPVFHDDQHGTAIIAAAAFLNAIEVTGRKLESVRVVTCGAGASAIAVMRLLVTLGLPKKNITLCDSTGVVSSQRTAGMNAHKAEFAQDTALSTLSEVIAGADVFIGLSRKGMLSAEMLRSMAPRPIVFAMANPDPEIDYELAKATVPDVVLATGRSDYPNQVNNVLGFPYIFRGALDVRATAINEEMKLAAVHALATLAKEPIPDGVRKAYGNADFSFGADYLIPKPFDPRVLFHVAPAVARAAMETGVAKKPIDLEEYTLALKAKQNVGRVILRGYYNLARKSKHKRIALPGGENPRVMKAAIMAQEEGIAVPVLVGNVERIREAASRFELHLNGMQIISPEAHEKFDSYVETYLTLRNRYGITPTDARREVSKDHVFSTLLLRDGGVDGMICGVDRYYPKMVRPILSIVGLKPGVKTAAGLYLVSVQGRLLFFADTTMNIEMTSERLASIAIMAAEFASSMNVVPRVALLSFSNFGSVEHPLATMVRKAKEIVKTQAPQLKVDGEMQADTALVGDILKESYPFCELDGPANVLIFPDMQSGNIAYKLLQRLGEARVVGPIILGLNKPAYVMQRHATVEEIFNMITAAVGRASLAN